jgi:adenylate cyclase
MAQRSESVAQTFLFADLSGFTALTEAHGDEQAADLVGGFCGAVRRLLAAHQAQEVKTIGDALMLRSGDAAAAIRLGLCIVHDVGAQHGFPLVRVGMHTGQRSSARATGSGQRSTWRRGCRRPPLGVTRC